MAVKSVQVPVPSDGTVVQIVDSDGDVLLGDGDELSIRNTGTVTVLLGGPDGNLFFPLAANEFWGTSVNPTDVVSVKVQTPGTAGQVSAIKTR